MALNKQPVAINFAGGLDQKTDDKQIQVGKFLKLKNSVFNKTGRLTKRNGFRNISNLPNAEQTTITTLNGNLIATGSNLYAYSKATNQWLDQGVIQPVSLETQSVIRSSTGQYAPDSAISSSGLVCTVFGDTDGNSYYQISDVTTGQQIAPKTMLPNSGTMPRVFLLGTKFIVTYLATISATPRLAYIAIPVSTPNSPAAPQDISTTVSGLTAGYDGIVANNLLYMGWEGASSDVKFAYLRPNNTLSPAVTITSSAADLMSITADNSGSLPIIYATWWDSGSEDAYSIVFSDTLITITPKTLLLSNIKLKNITSIANNGIMDVYYTVENYYDDTGAYPDTIETDYIAEIWMDQAGSVSASPSVLLRSVGLASKAFRDEETMQTYMMVSYGEVAQPTYFLIDSNGNIYMRLAGANGGGYQENQILPTVSTYLDGFIVPYEIKDFLASVNKGTDLPSGTPVNGIYTQTGINLAIFDINIDGQYSSEIANSLNLTGGQVWEYDGVKPVELGFHVYPENIAFDTDSSGGSISAQEYYYVFTYEWTDNQGNLHRSAPSIPLLVETEGATSVNTLFVPTLRLTYKTQPNPVRIVGYRWSTAQQTYYQFTSIVSPTLNDPSVDYVTITDTQSDAQILGQTLLYTTGGVVENICAPAAAGICLYKNRVMLIDAENRNTIWYSKQVIQNTPVEFSDLFTLYVAPTSGAQGSTGDAVAISAMDDKFVVFKRDAIYYITGNGPDNTGANNDFSDPIFITSSVGCINPKSIVLMPNGLMFQSDKGIWLLGRGLDTKYIGADVEEYNGYAIKSAQVIPGTNQVRFVMANNTTLMYDYYVDQWGTFDNRNAISGCLYETYDTYINSLGQVFQETPGAYLDGSIPVVMSFETGWINIAGVQGYERFYYLNLLGSYLTPFKLNVQIGYDYSQSFDQGTQITPDNTSSTWGSDALWGSGKVWGGDSNVFSARLFPQKQKCEAFKINIAELYDPSQNVPAGEGLTLSGLLLMVGIKRGSRTQSAAKSYG